MASRYSTIAIKPKVHEDIKKLAKHSIGDHHWTQSHLKTTKFIPSQPIVKVKKGEEPPF